MLLRQLVVGHRAPLNRRTRRINRPWSQCCASTTIFGKHRWHTDLGLRTLVQVCLNVHTAARTCWDSPASTLQASQRSCCCHCSPLISLVSGGSGSHLMHDLLILSPQLPEGRKLCRCHWLCLDRVRPVTISSSLGPRAEGTTESHADVAGWPCTSRCRQGRWQHRPQGDARALEVHPRHHQASICRESRHSQKVLVVQS
mmetsp:Transcript_59249/g.138752  ORF Transcript_59249/g.138752 Transcript_59249/m.138752 type:complete len:200 (+) Transcript_59249:1303-1902(+)